MSYQCSEQKKHDNIIDKVATTIPQEDYNIVNHTEEVVIGAEQGTTFPTKVGTTLCNALIDNGATRSYMSEMYYRRLR